MLRSKLPPSRCNHNLAIRVGSVWRANMNWGTIKIMQNNLKWVGMAALAVSLGACTSLNLFKDSTTQATAPPPVSTAPTGPTVTGALSAAQIKSLLTGKSWRWRGQKSGVTLYASDGTSLVEITGSGTTQGKWEAKDGQLCESFAPAPFLPQGIPLQCSSFAAGPTPGTYAVGKAIFSLAS